MSELTSYTSCLRIERTDGFVLCITDLDRSLVINDSILGLGVDDQTYLAPAGYTPTNMQSTSDNSVNNADIEGVLTAVGVDRNDIIGGRYDFAKLNVFIYDYENLLLVKKLGSGHWGESTVKDNSYVAEFRSLSQQVQQTIGRTFNPECDEQLGGVRCGVPLGNFPKSGAVTADTSKDYFYSSTVTDDNGFLTGAIATFTSGINDTVSAPVDYNIKDTHKVELGVSLPNEADMGASFDIVKLVLSGQSVTEVGTTNTFEDSGQSKINGYYNGWNITFTSGNNNGITYSVNTFENNIFTTEEMSNLSVEGDAFDLLRVVAGTITVIEVQRTVFTDTSLTEETGYFDGLTLEFTTGDNIGKTATIISYTGIDRTFTIDDANLTQDLTPGDGYEILKPDSGSITSIDKNKIFSDSSLTNPSGELIGYSIQFTSGPNTSDSYIISNQNLGIITLLNPTPADISPLDVYDINYEQSGVIDSNGASKDEILDDTILGSADFNGMTAQMDSGANAGQTSTIQSTNTGALVVSPPFPNYNLNGDNYSVINSGDNFMSLGEITEVTDNQNFKATLTDDPNFGDDYFNYGKLIFTGGQNVSIHMEVKDFIDVDNVFEMFLPFPFDIEVGDTFQVFAGCDKRLETCKTKFDNHINFQGFPYIPGQDAITKFGGQ